MSESMMIAVISAAGSILIAVTALVLNYRGFASIDNRFASLENRLTGFENRVHSDIRDLTGAVNELDKRLSRVEDKLQIRP